MNDTLLTLSKWLVAWGITYGVHSTVLVGIAWLVHRYLKNDRLSLAVWQFALIGGITTATITLLYGQIGWHGSPSTNVSPSAISVALSPTTIVEPSTSDNRTVPSLVSRDIDINLVLVWVLAVWFVLSGITALRFGTGYYRLFGLLRSRYPLENASILQFVDTLRRKAKIRSSLTIAVSDEITSPLVLPSREICLPRRVLEAMTVAQQQSVIAHEVAHIVHGDQYWRLVGQLVNVIFPFQLLNRYVESHIHELSEYRADAWAAQCLPSPLPLVQSLVNVAEWATYSNGLVTAMAVRPSTLQQRVERLLRPTPHSAFSRTKVGFGAVSVLLVLMLMTPTHSVMASLAVSALDPNGSPEPALPVLTLPTEQSVIDTIGSEDAEFPRNPHATLPPLPTTRPTTVVPPTPRPTVRAIEANDPFTVRWPVDGSITVQPSTNHMAIDIADEAGTPIMAAADGRVLRAGWDDTGYGYRLVLQHGNRYTTLYAHLQSITVETGDIVEAGDMIGRMGDTGRVTAPALHFEVRQDGARVNPYNYLP